MLSRRPYRPYALDVLQRSYGNQVNILYAWGRLEEALALLNSKKRSAWSWATSPVWACHSPLFGPRPNPHAAIRS